MKSLNQHVTSHILHESEQTDTNRKNHGTCDILSINIFTPAPS